MARRKLLSEKKRERLMQEHEQLQKLMLQARSSVRRSSLKNPGDIDAGLDISTNDESSISDEEELQEPDQRQEQAVLFDEKIFQREVEEENEAPLEHVETDSKPELINVILPELNTASSINFLRTPISEDVTEHPQTDAGYHEEVEPFYQESELPPADIFLQKRSRRKVWLAVTLLLLAIAGGAVYWAFFSPKPQPQIAQQSTSTNQRSQPSVPISKPDSLRLPPHETGPNPLPETTRLARRETVPTDAVKMPSDKIAGTKKETPKTASTGSSHGRYKVVSKAYFHDAPDAGTRRKAFIIHWNNAVLTPLQEENGFVYIVFTNHLGQTSKGWLRKEDLRRLDP